ncbi:hypothetical protein CSIM01_00628 [Colletotrichum simmondsii]|uniref:Uncharacterized protein n=1 Tax=Colletotrichum simmondsii TaxID=703756 RepID=A0A135SJ15_9PEZI|nr:hypothetical protein CSIM01_00628 [Colletotrichum simmondsii]
MQGDNDAALPGRWTQRHGACVVNAHDSISKYFAAFLALWGVVRKDQMGRREAWANLGACNLGLYLWGLAELRLWEQPQQCEREGLRENNGSGQEGGVTLPTGALARNETDEMVVGPRLGSPSDH